jgi:hypothetical protein
MGVGVREIELADSSRSKKILRTLARHAIVAAMACAFTISVVVPGFAQNDSEAPKGLPETTIAPEGGGAPPPPAADEGAAGATPPAPAVAPKPTHHKGHRSHKASYSGEVEPATGMLKLNEDTWAYSAPAKSSGHVERVHGGKFVNVTGTTRNYVQVKLKSGAVAYVPVTAVELARPTDKVFKLTKDTPVLSVPNHRGKRLAEVHRDHDVHIVGTSVNYMKIRMKDGVEGFISTSALE